MPGVKPPTQSPAEEFANALTHGIATMLALAGTCALIVPAVMHADALHVSTLSVYAASLLLLYTVSTCYHLASRTRWRRAWRSADHAAIYLLIAGTYTPFMLILVGGQWGVCIVTALWTLAIFGVVLKLFLVGRFSRTSTLLYILMGWTGLVAAGPICTRLPAGCIAWIFAGGVLYTAGVVFYQWKRLPFHHAIWHLFVTAASACHFIAVARYVLPK